VIYFKSILAGAAAFAVAVIIFAVIAIAVMPYFPHWRCAFSRYSGTNLDGAVTTPLVSLFGLPIGHHCSLAPLLS
jgi:hypothetical protein